MVLEHAWFKPIFQDLKTKVVIHVQLTEQHLRQVHCGLQDLGIREGAHVQNHLNVLLLDEVSTYQGLLRALLGEPYSLIDA